jgi:hypothetical protein
MEARSTAANAARSHNPRRSAPVKPSVRSAIRLVSISDDHDKPRDITRKIALRPYTLSTISTISGLVIEQGLRQSKMVPHDQEVVYKSIDQSDLDVTMPYQLTVAYLLLPTQPPTVI